MPASLTCNLIPCMASAFSGLLMQHAHACHATSPPDMALPLPFSCCSLLPTSLQCMCLQLIVFAFSSILLCSCGYGCLWLACTFCEQFRESSVSGDGLHACLSRIHGASIWNIQTGTLPTKLTFVLLPLFSLGWWRWYSFLLLLPTSEQCSCFAACQHFTPRHAFYDILQGKSLCRCSLSAHDGDGRYSDACMCLFPNSCCLVVVGDLMGGATCMACWA